LGTIGRLVLEQAVIDGFRPRAGVDPAAGLALSLAELSNDPGVLGPVLPSLDGMPKADIAFVCTDSRLQVVAPLFRELLERGYHVVSTCEELAYPWHTQPALSAELHHRAVDCRRVIVGAGVNPGFVMDVLALTIARCVSRVGSVSVTRRVDVAARRQQLWLKVGVGMDRDTFARNAREGITGHVGLMESATMVADLMGFGVRSSEFRMDPLVAASEIVIGDQRVEAGQCLGMRQEASVDGGGAVRLRLEMGLGLAPEEDRIVIEGSPSLTAVIPDGVPGDHATGAIVVSMGKVVANVSPGLRCAAELPLAVSSHKSDRPPAERRPVPVRAG
jgi:hypothetical protein